MSTRKEIIEIVDRKIASANPPMSNVGIASLLDIVNKWNGINLTFKDIPCLQSATVSKADVKKEVSVVPGAVLIAAPAILTTLVGHCINPDHGIEKLLIMGGLTTAAVLLNDPLTEIAKKQHGEKLLSLVGTTLPMMAIGFVRLREQRNN